MGKKYKHSEDDLKQKLNEQLRFLQRSANSYDRGDFAEAKRLAVTIRILVHDPDNKNSHSRSLLGQLGLKEQKFADTRIPPREPKEYNNGKWEQVSGPYCGLTIISTQGDYVPLLGHDEKSLLQWVNFEDWWEKGIIFDNRKDLKLTRKDLIRAVADQEGAHIDSELNPDYARLTKDNALGMFSANLSKPPEIGQTIQVKPFGSPADAAVRQVAHELLKTLLPDYVLPPQPPRGAAFGSQMAMIFQKRTDTKSSSLSPVVKKEPISPPILKGVKRNEPCPCGSGKKYKKCCGRT